MDILIALLLGLPFLAAIVSLLLLRNSNNGIPASLVATGSVIVTLIFSFILLGATKGLEAGEAYYAHYNWVRLHNLELDFHLKVDRLASSMMVIVTLIGTLVHLFSLGYMKTDEGRGRYFGCLSLFLFSMTGIVLAENLLTMFIFWELVGLSSYLLIGHWYHKQSAARASTKAFLANRIGDVGFLAGIIGLFAIFGTLSFDQIDQAVSQLDPSSPIVITMLGTCITLITVGIFCGAVGKSAQFPLHVWLPDAMEGPTPVSALIHAATMVAAGVYMLFRVSFLIEFDALLGGNAATIIAWIGAITALIAALIALHQDDIKKVLAYSTLSQLGYMVLAMGVLAPEAGFFHLFTHAWFKALLFLGAGAVIFACHHEQNIWRMGGLFQRMKITSITFLIGTAALAAVPFITAGFFSKEAILVASLDHGKVTALFAIAAFVAFLTPFYMTRVVVVAFFGKARSEHAQDAKEVGALMFVPLIVLAVFSVIAGYQPIAELFNIPQDSHGHHEGGTLALTVSLIALFGGFISALLIYGGAKREPLSLKPLRDKLYIDEFYDGLKGWIIDTPAQAFQWGERVLLNSGVLGAITGITRATGLGARKIQGGNLAAYATILVFGLVVLIFLTTFVR